MTVYLFCGILIYKQMTVCVFKYYQMLHLYAEISAIFYGLVNSIRVEVSLVFKSNLYIIGTTTSLI